MNIGIATISFNQAKYLPYAIESVMCKDRSRIKYVIADPGSTDGSRDIIMDYRDWFSDIIFEPDNGPADGLNKCFSRLKDVDILGYINSDDFYVSGAIDYVLDFFSTHPEVDVLLGAAKIVDENGKAKLRKRISSNFTAKDYLQGTALALQQATFFRQRVWDKVIGGFNVNNHTCWDAELLVDMSLENAVFFTSLKLLGGFRIYNDSISGSGRLLENYNKDQNRIQEKIAMKLKHSPLNSGINYHKFLFKYNPVRKIKEYLVV